MNRGYFAIGIYRTKTETNVGTLLRSALNFGAAYVFTIGRRYKRQSSDTSQTARHIPLFHYPDFDDFLSQRPHDCQLVCIENRWPERKWLPSFDHPPRAVYLLGAEDHGLPTGVLEKAQSVIEIPCGNGCFNVAAAGSIVMYDRIAKAFPK